MLNRNVLYLPFLILFIIFSACKKEDVTNPTISISEPNEGQSFLSGSYLYLNAYMEDDQELYQYLVIIEGIETIEKNFLIAPFQYNTIIGIEGKSEIETYKIDIPEAIASGNYILTVNVKDYSGNSSIDQKVGFYIQNSTDTINPEFNLEVFPNPITVGSKLIIRGTLSDNKELGALFITLLDIQGNKISQEDLHASGTEELIEQEVSVPSVPGQYIVKLLLVDRVSNQYIENFKIVVTQ